MRESAKNILLAGLCLALLQLEGHFLVRAFSRVEATDAAEKLGKSIDKLRSVNEQSSQASTKVLIDAAYEEGRQAGIEEGRQSALAPAEIPPGQPGYQGP